MVDPPPLATSLSEAGPYSESEARQAGGRVWRLGSSLLLLVAISAALVACYFLTGATGFLVRENPPDSSFAARAVGFTVLLAVAGIAASGMLLTRTRPASPTIVAATGLAVVGLLYVAAIGLLLTAGFFDYGPLMPLTFAWVSTAHLLPAVAPTAVLVDLWRMRRPRSKGRSAPKVSVTLTIAVAFGATTLPFVSY